MLRGIVSFLRRSPRRARYLRLAILLFILLNFLEVWHIHHTLSRPRKSPSMSHDLFSPVSNHRIFIASIHWNNEPILWERWNDAVVELVHALGPENVFLSIYESGSWDESKSALKSLDKKLEALKVPRNITLSETTHLDEISRVPGQAEEREGWIQTPRGVKELRRIPYLSKLRNIGLSQLKEMNEKGIYFDRILFLNDVAFMNDDIFELFNTNSGEYAAACSLDFSKPPLYYDTFALRDMEGHEHVMQTWPYFRSKTSRHALKSNQPVPVRSCWNGMVAMPTTQFISGANLKFRGVDDSLALSHVEGSECCLIHADNPESSNKGVFLNPKVRVGYNMNAYKAINPPGSWLTLWDIFAGLWKNRMQRWLTTVWLKEYIVGRRLLNWKGKHPEKSEPGRFCLINEMQVLIENGWKHL